MTISVQKVLVVIGVLIAFVCMLIGFDVVHADLDSHYLGWGFLAVVLIGVSLLL